LPPYVFTIIDSLKIEARRAGRDVVDLGFGNPDIPSPEVAVEKLAGDQARLWQRPARVCGLVRPGQPDRGRRHPSARGVLPTALRAEVPPRRRAAGPGRPSGKTTATLCTSGGDSGNGGNPPVRPVAYAGSPSNADVSCDIGSIKAGGIVVPGYVDRALNPPSGLEVVICSASASLDFANTPLAWGVFWTPTLHAQAEALPPPFRQ